MTPPERLPVAHRRTIFLAIIDAQDAGQSVAESRTAVAEKFGVSEEVVRAIEQEGVEEEWPPL